MKGIVSWIGLIGVRFFLFLDLILKIVVLVLVFVVELLEVVLVFKSFIFGDLFDEDFSFFDFYFEGDVGIFVLSVVEL